MSADWGYSPRTAPQHSRVACFSPRLWASELRCEVQTHSQTRRRRSAPLGNFAPAKNLTEALSGRHPAAGWSEHGWRSACKTAPSVGAAGPHWLNASGRPMIACRSEGSLRVPVESPGRQLRANWRPVGPNPRTAPRPVQADFGNLQIMRIVQASFSAATDQKHERVPGRMNEGRTVAVSGDDAAGFKKTAR